MPIEEVIARLFDAAKVLKTVGGAAEFAAIQTAPKQLPAAFVLPGAEAPGKNSLASGSISQRVTSRFEVAIAVPNVADASGRAAVDALKPVRMAIREALVLWVPGSEYEPIELAPSALLSVKNGVLWWREGFSTAYQFWRAR